MATEPNCVSRTSIQANREGFTDTAVAIERDFRRLVETLQHALDSADAIDSELHRQVSNTKMVAERGLRLSKLLTKMARGKR